MTETKKNIMFREFGCTALLKKCDCHPRQDCSISIAFPETIQAATQYKLAITYGLHRSRESLAKTIQNELDEPNNFVDIEIVNKILSLLEHKDCRNDL